MRNSQRHCQREGLERQQWSYRHRRQPCCSFVRHNTRQRQEIYTEKRRRELGAMAVSQIKLIVPTAGRATSIAFLTRFVHSLLYHHTEHFCAGLLDSHSGAHAFASPTPVATQRHRPLQERRSPPFCLADTADYIFARPTLGRQCPCEFPTH